MASAIAMNYTSLFTDNFEQNFLHEYFKEIEISFLLKFRLID